MEEQERKALIQLIQDLKTVMERQFKERSDADMETVDWQTNRLLASASHAIEVLSAKLPDAREDRTHVKVTLPRPDEL